MTDNEIIKAYEGLTPTQQLTLFRGLYYNDGYATERGIIANAINDILPEYRRQKAEIEQLRTEKDKLIRTYRECQEAVLAEFAERLRDVRQIVTVQDMDGTRVRTVITERDLIRIEKEMRGERREGHRTHMAAQAAEEKEDRLI